MYTLVKYLLLISVSILSFEACVNKSISKKKKEVISCRKIEKYIKKHPNEFKINIIGIDTNYHKYTTKCKGGVDCYVFRCNYIKFCSNYILWLDDIRFDFTLGTDDCLIEGDNVVLKVNAEKLGFACKEKGYSRQGDIYDCIYNKKPKWRLKISATFCDRQSLTFTNELNNVSLQCTDPNEN